MEILICSCPKDYFNSNHSCMFFFLDEKEPKNQDSQEKS
jgi:hypothetical protein